MANTTIYEQKNLTKVEKYMATQQMEAYLYYCKFNRDFTDDTLKTKYYHLRRFIRDQQLNDFRSVTNQQIDSWRAELSLELSKKTINNHVDDVVGCIKYLNYRRMEDVALKFEAVERHRIRYDNEDLPSFSPDEILHIRDHCQTLMEELIFSLTFETAMRLHEVTYLSIDDIRTVEGRMTYFRIEGKGRVRRNTFILQRTQELLTRWLELTGIREGYIFPSPAKDGLPYSTNQMRKIINRPIRRAGYEKGSPHALRRSAISIALDNGMALAPVSKWAGHTDPRVTLKHYYKQNNELLQAQHNEAFSKMFAAN